MAEFNDTTRPEFPTKTFIHHPDAPREMQLDSLAVIVEKSQSPVNLLIEQLNGVTPV